jgi:hypothetical protein
MAEFRPVVGFEGLYEISRDGRLFAVQRTIVQKDAAGRNFKKTIKRHQKVETENGKGYRAYNLHKDNRQTCRLITVLVRESWGEEAAEQIVARNR